MEKSQRIGIIICDRYRSCSGGKCLRALKERAGAFSIYRDSDVELAGYTSCGGCPGGNIEYAGEEMVKNGVAVIHSPPALSWVTRPARASITSSGSWKSATKCAWSSGTHPIPAKYHAIRTNGSGPGRRPSGNPGSPRR